MQPCRRRKFFEAGFPDATTPVRTGRCLSRYQLPLYEMWSGIARTKGCVRRACVARYAELDGGERRSILSPEKSRWRRRAQASSWLADNAEDLGSKKFVNVDVRGAVNACPLFLCSSSRESCCRLQ